MLTIVATSRDIGPVISFYYFISEDLKCEHVLDSWSSWFDKIAIYHLFCTPRIRRIKEIMCYFGVHVESLNFK